MKTKIAETDFDLRAEVVAATLAEQTDDLDDLIVRPRSLFRRAYSKDVLRVDDQFVIGNRRFTLLDVAREGLFDALPEGLFHQARPIAHQKDLDQKLKAITKRREEEKAAREFFLAFEREFYLKRILIELKERTEIAGFSEAWISSSFLKFWGLDLRFIDRRKAAFLLYLLPLASKLPSNYQFLAKCVQILFDAEAIFEKRPPPPITVDENLAPILGDSRVGEDLVLAGALRDGSFSLKLTLGPIKNEDVLDFLPGRAGTKLLKLLFDYFLPFNWEVEVDIRPDANAKCFELTEISHAARLGLTTVL